MKTDLELWQFAAEHLRIGQNVTLLVVAESAGSSPGRPGFKMFVGGHELRGSVGGGVMEVALVELAKEKRNAKKNFPAIIEQIHRKNSPHSSGMICSGRQTVIFFELNSAHLKTVRHIIRALKNNLPGRFQISNSKFQVLEDQPHDADLKFTKKGADEFIYEEKLGPQNKLFIVGGGHCALALSELMSKLDFHIALFDDRTDLNTLAKNRFADEKRIIDSYERIGEFINSGDNVYVVVMTLGYKFDEIVIRALFDKNFKYFGVLGSRAKMRTLLQSLEKEGFDRKKLAALHTPVGLRINSRTPAEIAVSIAAQIIAVKNSAV